MFYSIRYARALNKLGLGRLAIEHEKDIMYRHGEFSRRNGRSPIESAVAYFGITIQAKVLSNPELYLPIAMIAKEQMIEWVACGKCSQQVAVDACKELGQALRSVSAEHLLD